MAHEEELYIPGLIDTRPNPLGELGITDEIAGKLSVEGLQRAVTAMYRVWVTELHPDKHSGKTTAEMDRQLLRINTAYERAQSEDIGTLQANYVAEAREKRQKSAKRGTASKPDTMFGVPTFNSGESTQSLGIAKSLISNLLNGLADPEATPRFDHFDMLVQSLPRGLDMEQNITSSQIVSYNRGQGMTIRETEQSISRILPGAVSELAPHTDGLPTDHTIIYVHDGQAQSFRQLKGVAHGDAVTNIDAPTLGLSDGWHIVRGIQTPRKDSRSLQSITQTTSPDLFSDSKVDIVGSLSPGAWKRLVKLTVDSPRQKRIQSLEAGDTLFQDDHGLSFEQTYLSFTVDSLLNFLSADRNGGQQFVPKIVPNWTLIGQKDYGKKSPLPNYFPIGTIEYAILS